MLALLMAGITLVSAAGDGWRTADLVVTGVSGAPSHVVAGKTIRVVSRVRNVGAVRSGPFVVRFLLSRDARQSRGDTVIGVRAVGALELRRAPSGQVRLRIPRIVRPGRWFLIACADGARRVLESREDNNCRVAAGRVTVLAPPSADAPPRSAPQIGLGTALPGAETTVSVGGIRVTVPAGTVTTPSAVRVQRLPAGDHDLGGVGADIHIDADWQDGVRAVQITMPLAVEPDSPVEQVPAIVHDRADGTREILSGSRLVVNPAAHTVSFTTTSLSRFWSILAPARLVSGGPAITNVALARAQFAALTGLRADQPKCSPDITGAPEVDSSGTAFRPSSLLGAQPAIRHCVAFRAAGAGEINRGRWTLANNTGAVMRVTVSGGARVVNFGIARDLLTDVAFLALNGASGGIVDNGTSGTADAVYSSEVIVPPGAAVVVVVDAGGEGRVVFSAVPGLQLSAFALRQLGDLLGSRSEAVEFLGFLNACGYSLAVNPFRDVPSKLRCALDLAQAAGSAAIKRVTGVLRKSLLVLDAALTVQDTLVYSGGNTEARLAYGGAPSSPTGGSSPSPDDAIAQLNTWRAAGGLPPVAHDPAKTAGCRAHVEYVRRNGIRGHFEDPALPGYTSEGDFAARSSVLIFDIPQGTGPRMWEGAPYHRAALLDPTLAASGYWAEHGTGCMAVVAGELGSYRDLLTPEVRAYPYPRDQQLSVPTTFSCNESPNPCRLVPDATRVGFVLTVQFTAPWYASEVLSIDSATLVPDGGAPVAVTTEGPRSLALIDSAIAIIPNAPLRPGTWYTAHATGAVSDLRTQAPFDVSWRFRTAG